MPFTNFLFLPFFLFDSLQKSPSLSDSESIRQQIFSIKLKWKIKAIVSFWNEYGLKYISYIILQCQDTKTPISHLHIHEGFCLNNFKKFASQGCLDNFFLMLRKDSLIIITCCPPCSSIRCLCDWNHVRLDCGTWFSIMFLALLNWFSVALNSRSSFSSPSISVMSFSR